MKISNKFQIFQPSSNFFVKFAKFYKKMVNMVQIGTVFKIHQRFTNTFNKQLKKFSAYQGFKTFLGIIDNKVTQLNKKSAKKFTL